MHKTSLLIIAAAILGIGLGVMLKSTLAPNHAQLDAKIETYIQENPEIIISALNQYMSQQADAERQQAINLVSANDGKTIIGNPNGDVTIYEFSDYNCGYCKRAFADVMAAVNEDGNIRLVIKEFPILAESSVTAAQLSMAAAEIGRFEEFHTALMTWQGGLNDDSFEKIANDLNIDINTLNQIIAKGDIDQAIRETQTIAAQIGFSGTPSFIIGNQIAPGYISKDDILELVQQARQS